MADTCDAWIRNSWREVDIHFALARPELIKRCSECHGHIRLHVEGKGGSTCAHVEHKVGHPGCSRGNYFDGKRSPHPDQVATPSSTNDSAYEGDIVQEDEESAFAEGAPKYRLHRSRERDSKLVRSAKAKRLREAGKLECEVCSLDFLKQYGEVGRGFIEAHHTTPVAQLTGNSKTKITELALVCSNCHRILHRCDPLLSVGQLKSQIAAKASKATSS